MMFCTIPVAQQSCGRAMSGRSPSPRRAGCRRCPRCRAAPRPAYQDMIPPGRWCSTPLRRCPPRSSRAFSLPAVPPWRAQAGAAAGRAGLCPGAAARPCRDAGPRQGPCGRPSQGNRGRRHPAERRTYYGAVPKQPLGCRGSVRPGMVRCGRDANRRVAPAGEPQHRALPAAAPHSGPAWSATSTARPA